VDPKGRPNVAGLRAAFVCEEIVISDEIPEFGRAAVHEFSSQFDSGWR
jgi:hypothetical protein